jgi:hypothetical protein
MLHKSLVAGVEYMVPLKPRFTKLGKLPLWSICACERTTASIDAGSNEKFLLRSFASLLLP